MYLEFMFFGLGLDTTTSVLLYYYARSSPTNVSTHDNHSNNP
jgi:hypothetical protein